MPNPRLIQEAIKKLFLSSTSKHLTPEFLDKVKPRNTKVIDEAKAQEQAAEISGNEEAQEIIRQIQRDREAARPVRAPTTEPPTMLEMQQAERAARVPIEAKMTQQEIGREAEAGLEEALGIPRTGPGGEPIASADDLAERGYNQFQRALIEEGDVTPPRVADPQTTVKLYRERGNPVIEEHESQVPKVLESQGTPEPAPDVGQARQLPRTTATRIRGKAKDDARFRPDEPIPDSEPSLAHKEHIDPKELGFFHEDVQRGMLSLGETTKKEANIIDFVKQELEKLKIPNKAGEVPFRRGHPIRERARKLVRDGLAAVETNEASKELFDLLKNLEDTLQFPKRPVAGARQPRQKLDEFGFAEEGGATEQLSRAKAKTHGFRKQSAIAAREAREASPNSPDELIALSDRLVKSGKLGAKEELELQGLLKQLQLREQRIATKKKPGQLRNTGGGLQFTPPKGSNPAGLRERIQQLLTRQQQRQLEEELVMNPDRLQQLFSGGQ